ncbi:hypothetical protein HZI73_03795 [Vallitalea pronyensis]|uniref:Uncharacterized protein n=1 Tax=Vallitalea pronyensis TaxID=1348613 RepID=A0A8J8SFL6_9FIRM|nr:hypothetical protein [Vallitalea pronyensis]QUI21462.1 hypothetical protein HZI73_03795 [Vallitalea pronyensis]
MKKQIVKITTLVIIMTMVIITGNFTCVLASEAEGIDMFTHQYRTFIQYADGTIKGSGLDREGSLGVGSDTLTVSDYDYKSSLTNVIGIPTSSRIKKVLNTQRLACILTEEGNVYISGDSLSAAMGTPVNSVEAGKFHKVDFPVVEDVYLSFGGNEIVGLTKDGQVWYVGSDPNGISDKYPATANRLMGIDAVVAFEARGVFFIKENGELWQVQSHDTVPIKLSGFNTVKSICTHTGSNFVLEDNGNLIAWGDNYSNIISDTDGAIDLDNKVIFDTDVKEFKDTYYIKNSGDIYFKYNNKYRLIGNLKNQGIDIVKIASGKSIAIIGNDGYLYTAGYNYYGSLATGDNVDKTELTKITTVPHLIDVIVDQNIYVLDKDGKLYGAGKELYTLSGKEQSYSLKYIMDNTNTLSTNSFFTYFFVDNDNKLYICGYNKGQLGTGTKTNIEFIKQHSESIGSINGTEVKNIEVVPEISYSKNILIEDETNNGNILDDIIMTLTNDYFTGNNNDDFVLDNKVTVNNVPSGIVAKVNKDSDSQVTLSLEGNADNHDLVDSLTNLEIVFSDLAFEKGNANNVVGSTKSDITINFLDPSHITYTSKELIENSTNDGSISTIISASLHTNKFNENIGEDLVEKGKVTVQNCPDGLTVKVKLNSDNNATISLVGNAINHTSENNISDLKIIFEDSLFLNQNDLNIQDKSVDLSIKFIDSPNVKFSSNEFNEVITNNGIIGNAIDIVLQGDTFTGINGDDVLNNIEVIGSIPDGLTLKATKIDDTKITLALDGIANDHSISSNTKITLNIKDTAFSNISASDIIGSSTIININFIDTLNREKVESSISTAENSELREDYNNAIQLYDLLIDNDKSDLQLRLKYVQVNVNLKEADQLLLTAEETKNEDDITLAQVKVDFIKLLKDMLPDESVRLSE